MGGFCFIGQLVLLTMLHDVFWAILDEGIGDGTAEEELHDPPGNVAVHSSPISKLGNCAH